MSPPAQPPSPATQRLDQALVERGLAPSRERAQALIAAGMVEVAGEKAASAARRVAIGDALRLLGRDHPYASRGGIKLAAALDAFAVDPFGRVALDSGASTGGFTDVLLLRGVALVYAVDVGYGQLAGRLAADARVRVLDRTNLRLLRELPGPAPSLVTLDLSFISLRTVLPAVAALAEPGAEVVALVKPQFEVGREHVGKGGIVRDQALSEQSAHDLLAWAGEHLGTAGEGPVPSPIAGGKGNREWLVHLRLPEGRT
ncbi:MAG TPA: TlyA family RNA methyltransferase [Candidatus Angelobacter sp.]|nr:TlyA family RNA methyltransferase [Candidatus Angelobacter sp.]